MLDTKALSAAMAPVIREAVERAQGPLLARIETLERRAPDKGEPGAPGEPGERGADGRDGAAGAPGADGRDGLDGKDGRDGEPGPAGEPGQRGADGRDGVGLAGAVIDRNGSLILTLSDGTTRELGMVIGRDGLDGAHGKDGERGPAGFSLDEFEVRLADDGRTVLMSFGAGEQRIERSLSIPTMIYRGVFKEGQGYAKGDTVTWAGSLWHCDSETSEKPGDGAKAWTLAAKRGRDGKDFAGPQPRAQAPVKV